MASEFRFFSSLGANNYLKALESYVDDTSSQYVENYYNEIANHLIDTITEIHIAQTGTTLLKDSNDIKLGIRSNEGLDKKKPNLYRNYTYHLELLNEYTGNLIRILPSPFRDGVAIVSMYALGLDILERDKYATADTLACELVTPLINLYRPEKLGGLFYAFLNDKYGRMDSPSDFIESEVNPLTLN